MPANVKDQLKRAVKALDAYQRGPQPPTEEKENHEEKPPAATPRAPSAPTPAR